MSIQSSLYSGISGLTTNGNAMSIIGNNIANTNTIGFKSSRAVFSDLLSSSISGSGGESQIGRGVGLSTVDNIFAQGTFEATESNTDLAVEGSGFFMMRETSGQELQFSRAGAFRFNSNGNLINPEGFFVQGYTLDADANPIGDVIDIQVATATSGYTPANPTSSVTLSTNLNSKTPYITSNATQGSATASGLELNVLANDVSLSDPNLILTIEGEPIAVAGGGTAQQGSAKNIADGINAAAIGVTASITAPTLDLGDISLAGATLDLTGANLTINGYNIEGTLHQGTNLLQELRTLINARSAETNVTAMAGATQL
jgi:flagellar hook protein FlgE